MKKYFSFGLIALAAAVSVMSGLERTHLSSYSFGAIMPEVLPFTPEKDVVITAKMFSSKDSKFLLGHNLNKRNVVPIQVDVQNNTSNEYSLCASSVDLPHINPKKVAFKVFKSSIPRAIGWRIAGFFFWPLMIPGTIDGAISYSHYRNLRKDLEAKSLKEKGEVISPYTTFHRILYVPKNKVKNSFAVTIIDLETLEPKSMETKLINPEEPSPSESIG